MKYLYFSILSKKIKSIVIKDYLEQHINQIDEDIIFETRNNEQVYRGIDPTFIVAIIGAAGTGLGALITSLLQLAKHKLSRKIVITSKYGNRIEVPVGVPKEELDYLIEEIKRMDSDDFKITIP